MLFFKPVAILFVFRSSSGTLYKTKSPLFKLCYDLLMKPIKSWIKVGHPLSKEAQAIRAPMEASLSMRALYVMLGS